MTDQVTVTIGKDVMAAVRVLNAKINGSMGGRSKSRKQTLARKRSAKIAGKARLAA